MKKMIATLLVLLPATAGLSFGQTRGGRPTTRVPRASNETPSTQTPRASEMAEPYRDALTNISIFARDHRAAGDRNTPPPNNTARAVNPETYLVFRGVAKEGATFTGFIEDTRDSSIFKVNVGDSLERPRHPCSAWLDVTEIVLRRTSGGQSQPIELGCNLLGREVAPPEPPAIQPSTFGRRGTITDLQGFTQQVNAGRRGRGNQDPTQTQGRNPNGGGGGGRGRRGGGGNSGG